MDMHNTHPFSVSFEYASGKIGERFQNPLWQITELFFGRQLRASVAQVKAFGTTIVASAVKSRQNKESARIITSSGDTKTFDAISGSLINSLLDSIDDHQMVADAALNYLSAGEYSLQQYASERQLTMHRQRHHCPGLDMGFLSAHATPTSDGSH